jgi:hypothetical protein|nr:MAG TPA: hypothetical protein [Caudoviricetes sp.]
MQSKTTINLSELDELRYRLQCGANAVNAIHEAMVNGARTAESWLDALFAACLFLNDIHEDFRQLIDGPEKGETTHE